MSDPLTAAALEELMGKLSHNWLFDIPNDTAIFPNPIQPTIPPYPIKSSRTLRHSSHTLMYKWLFKAWIDIIRHHADAIYHLADQLENRKRDPDDQFYVATILDEHRHLQTEIQRQADFLHFHIAFAAYQQHSRYTSFLRTSTFKPIPPLNEFSRASKLFQRRWAYVPFPLQNRDIHAPNIPTLLTPLDSFQVPNTDATTSPNHSRPSSSTSSHHVIKRNKVAHTPDARSPTPPVDDTTTTDDYDADPTTSVSQSILQESNDEYFSANEDDEFNA